MSQQLVKTYSQEYSLSHIDEKDFVNHKLDIAGLRKEFETNRILSVKNWLNPEVDNIMYDYISNISDWDVSIFDNNGLRRLHNKTLQDMGMTYQEYVAQILSHNLKMHAGTPGSFSYLYCLKEPQDLPAPMPQFAHWLDGPFSRFMESITGKVLGKSISVYVTNYAPGCFLKTHSDEIGDRGVAFIISFARDWRLDYGGALQLQFKGKPIQTFVPGANTLNLFDIENQEHFVSQVAQFAPLGRYTITGWLQDPTKAP